jgi:predicted nucleotidyltransferase
LTIFTAGSFARLEASEHSDVDLFFTYQGSGKTRNSRRTNELRLFGRLIDLVDELGFPAFSNDAQYLQTHNVEDILRHLGGPTDDAHNHFTLRMLLILESYCIFGQERYEAALRDIIHSYYRDFPRHEDSFQPWFLMNDIMRYWKTMLLNYENKRNSRLSGDEGQGRRVKNFKIRFSRMTTCFATIAALSSFPATPTEEDVFGLTQKTPRDRLLLASENMPVLKPNVQAILTEYGWFLEQTSLSKEDLHARFAGKKDRTMMFDRAESYGQLVYQMLLAIDGNRGTSPDLLRYLVI